MQARRELRRSIKQYATKFAKAVAARQVGQPGAGDCMHCHWQAEGKALGDALNDTDHLLSHIEEDYFVPSLLWNALREVSHAPMEESLLGVLSGLTYPEDTVEFALQEHNLEYIRKGVTRILVKYLSARLLK